MRVETNVHDECTLAVAAPRLASADPCPAIRLRGGDVKLIQVPNKFLRLNESLPFAIRDSEGRLMLAANINVDQVTMLSVLKGRDLYADEAEASAWRRQLTSGLAKASWNDASLHSLARALPQQNDRDAAAVREASFIEQWNEQAVGLVGALRDLRADTNWLARLVAVRDQARQLAGRRLDASLYHLVFSAGHATEHHCANHSLLCMVITREVTRMLDWPEALTDTLERAALTMNVAVRRLQDQLAGGEQQLNAAMRAELDGHAANGARLLEAGGAADPAWIAIVAHHHDDTHRHRPVGELTDVERAVALLRRVDVFVERLNRRGARMPVLPVQAAREACLGADGKPDQIGAALLKSVGLYPPGSFVQLVNGETGIVIARGQRANLPVVAALRSQTGVPLVSPALRDTADPRHAVKRGIGVEAVNVLPPHERLVAMR